MSMCMFGRSVRLMVLSVIGFVVAGNVASAQVVEVTAPGDPIFGVVAVAGGSTSIAVVGTTNGQNQYPAAESPPNVLDNNLNTKYLNFAKFNTGVILTPAFGASSIQRMVLATANDAPGRDPLTYTIEGTNVANPSTAPGASWTLISSGNTGLATDPGRNTVGPNIDFSNTLTFLSYRILFPTVRNPVSTPQDNSMQISELSLFVVPVPEPTSMALMGVAAAVGLVIRRRSKVNIA